MKKSISPIQERIDFIIPYLKNIKKNTKIIDLGCGTGLLSKEIYLRKNISIIGVDLDKNNIDIAKKQCPENKYYCADIKKIKNKLKADVIICSEVLEHLSNPSEILKKINNAIDNKGIVLITIPNGYGPWEILENQPLEIIRNFIQDKPKVRYIYYRIRDIFRLGAKDSINSNEGSRHVQRFTLIDILKLFKKTKFKIIEQKNTHFFSSLLPFIVIRTKIPFVYHLDRWICRLIPKKFSSGWGFLLKKE